MNKSCEIVAVCYEAIKAKENGKYLKKQLAEDMGVAPSDVSALLKGKGKKGVDIGWGYAEKLSHALTLHGIDVTPGHILDGLTQENWSLVPEHPEHHIDSDAPQGPFEPGQATSTSEVTFLGPVSDETVPLLTSIPAGDWKEWIDNFPPGYGEETAPRLGLKGKHVFAIRVTGDSMVGDDLQPGDVLYINPEREFIIARGGRIGVVRWNGGYKIRKVMLAGDGKHYRLVPSNPAYEEELVPIEEAKVFKIVRWMPQQNGKF